MSYKPDSGGRHEKGHKPGKSRVVHYDSDMHGVPRVTRNGSRSHWDRWEMLRDHLSKRKQGSKSDFGGPGF